jgi:hypothetical protein
MIFRLTKESDLEVLGEMKWQHECEDNNNFDVSKTEFTDYCKLFLREG